MRLRQLKLPGRVRLLTDRVPAISQSCHNGAVRPQVTWLLSSGHHLSVFVANISKCYPKEQMNFYLRLDMFHSNSCSVTVLLRSPRNVDLFRQVLSLKYQESVHVMLRSRVPAVAHHLDGPSMLTPGRLAERSGRLQDLTGALFVMYTKYIQLTASWLSRCSTITRRRDIVPRRKGIITSILCPLMFHHALDLT